MAEGDERVIEPETEPEEVENEPPGDDELPEPPVFMGEEEPPQEEDKAKYWILKDPSQTNKEVAQAHGLNENTVRIARNHLENDGYLGVSQRPTKKKKEPPGKALTEHASGKGMQIFAKGAAPEAIIENITIPMVDGQSQGFEQGMKFGMTQLVLAVRVMQELSSIGLQQVKPLIDMTKSVREGEAAAFKGGADEGALKAAQAMGSTILPMLSEMQAAIANTGKGSEADPFKSMMVRTMEPLMKGMMGKLIPGMKDEPPSGWTRKTE